MLRRNWAFRLDQGAGKILATAFERLQPLRSVALSMRTCQPLSDCKHDYSLMVWCREMDVRDYLVPASPISYLIHPQPKQIQLCTETCSSSLFIPKLSSYPSCQAHHLCQIFSHDYLQIKPERRQAKPSPNYFVQVFHILKRQSCLDVPKSCVLPPP